jgi:hypothetical protein
MAGGIRWDLLGDLGKNFVGAYDKAQDNETARQRLALLGQHENLRLAIELRKQQQLENSQAVWDKIGANLAGGGDSLGSPTGLGSPNTPVPTSPSANASPRLPTFAQGSNIGNYAGAISGIESGGRYDITGPTSPKYGRALGKYQIMEANLPEWSQAALGRQVSADEFLKSPDIQDAIFQHRFGGYVQKYGSPERAAAAWFSGSPDISSSKRDSLGTSVQKYVSMFSNNLRRAGDGQTPDLPETRVALPADAAPPATVAAAGVPPTVPGDTWSANADLPRRTQVASNTVTVPNPFQADDGKSAGQVLTEQQQKRDQAAITPPGAAPGGAVRPAKADEYNRQLIGLMVRDPSTRAAGLQMWKELRSGEKWQIHDLGPQGRVYFNPQTRETVPIPGTVADKTDPKVKAAADLRGEFDNHQEVKTFNQISEGYNRVLGAVQQRIADPNTVSPAADIALVFGLMKMLDPPSVVRESEQADARNAGGVPERIRNTYNKLLTGEFLTDSQRQDFVNQANAQYKASRGRVEGLSKRYQKLAERQGLDPEDVVYMPGAAPIPQVAKPTPAQGSQVSGAPQAVERRTLDGASYFRDANGTWWKE